MVYKPTYNWGGPSCIQYQNHENHLPTPFFKRGFSTVPGPLVELERFLFCSRPLVQVPAKTIWCMNWGCELQLRSQEYRLLTCNQKSKIWIYLTYCPYFLQRWSQVKKKNGRGQNQDEEQLEEVARAWGATRGCTDSRYSFRTRGLVALCIPR